MNKVNEPAVVAAGYESSGYLKLISTTEARMLPPDKNQRKSVELTLVDLRGGGLKQTPITIGNHLTESGNSDRLVAAITGQFKYCPIHRRWYAWSGKHWEADSTGKITARAKDVADSIYAEAMVNEEDRTAILRHAARSGTAKGVRAMIELAAVHSGLIVLPDQFNRHPMRLNVFNGTIDLETGRLLKHDKASLITHCLPLDYDPDATCPVWLTFLDRVFAGNDDLIDFVQRAVGYSLTADTREQCLFFLYGHGRNGKTTFINVMLELLGSYSLRTPTETLMVRRGEGVPNDIARLDGPRLVTASEVAEGHRLNESRVKDLTGGDRMSARFMKAEFFDFTPVFKLWMAGNHKPRITGTDDGIWRRIRLIPFTVAIPPDEVDKKLPEKLDSELAGILRWAVDGCLTWQESDLVVPEAVTIATSAYRSEMDTLGEFIENCCVTGSDFKVKASDLYQAYSTWCGECGFNPLNVTNFGLAFSERGFDKKRMTRGQFYLGIGLKQ